MQQTPGLVVEDKNSRLCLANPVIGIAPAFCTTDIATICASDERVQGYLHEHLLDQSSHTQYVSDTVIL